MSTNPDPDVEQTAFELLRANEEPTRVVFEADVPAAVPVELLSRLQRIISPREEVVSVVRGSVLLRHWYGPRARPAADLDLEVFLAGPDRGRRFTSAVDHVRQLCAFAAGPAPDWRSGIAFREPVGDIAGADLWEYGTPGQRFFVGWTSQNLPTARNLQIDVAQAGDYTRGDLGVRDEGFDAPDGSRFPFACYPKEAMLAAKLSWVVRGLSRVPGGVRWAGEPKDLFDAHLLGADPALRPAVFRRAMLTIGAADGLVWHHLDRLFDVCRFRVADADFGNWPAFAARHPTLAPTGPAALWAELAGVLEPLLGDLYPAADIPFLAAVAANPADTLTLLVYADWLDERSDPRGRVARLVAAVRGGTALSTADRAELSAALADPPGPWVHHLFGTTANLRTFRGSVEPAVAPSTQP